MITPGDPTLHLTAVLLPAPPDAHNQMSGQLSLCGQNNKLECFSFFVRIALGETRQNHHYQRWIPSKAIGYPEKELGKLNCLT